MTWKTIRLELGRTREFPKGSASRTYLLRLPLDERGRIDRGAISREPGHATVRRFWPNERDMSGRVIATNHGWALRYDDGDGEFGLETEPVRLGACFTVAEPDGRLLPFRVAGLANAA